LLPDDGGQPPKHGSKSYVHTLYALYGQGVDCSNMLHRMSNIKIKGLAFLLRKNNYNKTNSAEIKIHANQISSSFYI